uniref:Carboxylic ester hydrolase n=1 Tax=Colaphellus bowringi TaxID=561076 RepID=A0A221LCK9_9CUCU|nr:putative juvenile hormone esterase 1 [Colaphellus bowringi]
MLVTWFIGCFCILEYGIVASEYQQVRISDGSLRGKIWKTRNDRKFTGFTGIPYAKSPVGPLRFQPPVPIDPWDGTLNATEIHSVCPQRDVYRRTTIIEGEEDCLYLNVYTPKLSRYEEDPLPVMVFFHGGGWLAGGGNSLWYGPDILLDRDIVLVVPNYRLGALGFLSTGDEVVSGNNGLKDQNLALKWTKKNIDKFGGDPESITIFGESAGGASSQYHLLSPLSRGLFKGAILQSGTPLCPWAFSENNENLKNSQKLARSLNCPTEPTTEMVECLRKVDALTIIKQDEIFKVWDYDPMIPFKPSVEPKVEGAFLTDHPLNLIKSGQSMDVPVIAGLTTEDGGLKAAGYENVNLVDEFDQKFDEIVPVSFGFDRIVKDTAGITRNLRKFYFGNKKIDKSALGEIVNLYTDGWFLKGVDDTVRLQHKYYKSPVYYYLFGYRGSASMTKIFNGGDKDYGVCHADDLQYLFPIGDGLFPDVTPSEDDKRIAKLLTTLWANFAKTGNPSPEVNDLIPEKWTPYSSEKEEYYFIDKHSTEIRHGLYKERVEFWRSVLNDPLNEKSKDEL